MYVKCIAENAAAFRSSKVGVGQCALSGNEIVHSLRAAWRNLIKTFTNPCQYQYYNYNYTINTNNNYTTVRHTMIRMSMSVWLIRFENDSCNELLYDIQSRIQSLPERNFLPICPPPHRQHTTEHVRKQYSHRVLVYRCWVLVWGNYMYTKTSALTMICIPNYLDNPPRIIP